MANIRYDLRVWTLAIGLFLVIAMSAPAPAMMISQFDAPAADGTTPMFVLDTTSDTLTGGWGDERTGLDLEMGVAGGGSVFIDAYFTMSPVAYTGPDSGGDTGGGTLTFYPDGGGVPLMQITFAKGYVSNNGFGAMDLSRGDGVVISGSAFSNTFVNESFVFDFDHQTALPNGGFSATASFVASGTALPEPMTALLLVAGAVSLTRRRRATIAGK